MENRNFVRTVGASNRGMLFSLHFLLRPCSVKFHGNPEDWVFKARAGTKWAKKGKKVDAGYFPRRVMLCAAHGRSSWFFGSAAELIRRMRLERRN
jgi:hypothetical protein